MARSTLRRADRVSGILERLAQDGSVDAGRLATEFKVSAATIRRDLQMLEDQKLLSRTHGGAVTADVAYELPVLYRGGHHREQKRAIARCAVSRLPHGPLTIGFTGGTTTYEVARLIAERFDLTVVTNALNIATEMVLRPHIRTVSLGGVARPQSYEVVGPLAHQVLQELWVDHLFLGVDGISEEGGASCFHEGEASINALMVQRAQEVTVVAGSHKLGQRSFARICDATDINRLVTDRDADPALVAGFEALGVEVVLA